MTREEKKKFSKPIMCDIRKAITPNLTNKEFSYILELSKGDKFEEELIHLVKDSKPRKKRRESNIIKHDVPKEHIIEGKTSDVRKYLSRIKNKENLLLSYKEIGNRKKRLWSVDLDKLIIDKRKLLELISKLSIP